MSYYETLDEDITRAKEILAKGRMTDADFVGSSLPPAVQQRMIEMGGTIFAGDIFAAYKLLESFVAELERTRAPQAKKVEVPEETGQGEKVGEEEQAVRCRANIGVARSTTVR